MTTSLYIQCVVMLILGQALQVFLIKVPDLKQRAKIANQQFIWKDWWIADWNTVVATTILGAMVIIGLNEIAHWNSLILDYIKWFFAAIGAFGSNVALAKWSSYAKYFNGVIDTKTNIADGLPPPDKKP